MEYLGYFLLGLSLNLTPCVYPMLTITLSLFRDAEKASTWQAFGRACFYVAGIAAMYTILGLVAAYTGSFFGGLLQNFWVLLLLGLFILALSLSLFGLYTFRLPSWMIPQQHQAHHTRISLFLSGLLVGVVAAPCMGPVVLALLAHISEEANPVIGAFSFLILAMGLGTPYLILGTFGGLLRKLPKSGAWLVWVERLLGVILFTFGCFYLVIAFRWPILPWLIPSACLLGGFYLGWLEGSVAGPGKFFLFKRIAGTLAILVGIGLAVALFLEPPSKGLAWEKYRPGILEEAAASRQPVILDFYADWCIPCHELDQWTYSDSKIILALNRFRKVKVDATTMDAPGVVEVARRFSIIGVPTIVFLDAEGEEVPELRIDGYISPEELLQLLIFSRLKDHISTLKNV